MYTDAVDATVHDDIIGIESAKAGDAAAFGALVQRCQEVAFRAAYLLEVDRAAAADVAQEGFIRAYGSLAGFRSDAPFRPWLLRIVTNLARNELRSRAPRTGLFARLAPLAARTTPPPDADLTAQERASTLLGAVNDLPLDDRVVLYLRYFLELPEREIAQAIGKPTGTVESRLHRAAARLRRVIEERYPELMERDDE